MAKRNFEDRLSRLEEISERIQSQEVPIEEAVGLFEEGIGLAKGLEKDLARVERRIEILVNEPNPEVEDEKPEIDLFGDLAD